MISSRKSPRMYELRGSELYPLLNTGEDISKVIAGHLSPPLLMHVLQYEGP